jgi:hypothetical protein
MSEETRERERRDFDKRSRERRERESTARMLKEAIVDAERQRERRDGGNLRGL